MAPQADQQNESDLLALSLAEWHAHWDVLGPLTRQLERRKALEYEVRCNFAAKGQVPRSWVADEIRSGEFERRRARSLRNLAHRAALRDMWRRQGYTFDSEHRLIAPRNPPIVRRRPGVAIAARPREQGRGRSRVTRAGPKDDPDPPSAAAGLSHPAAVAASLRRDILCRFIFTSEALKDGDTGMAHAVALDGINDFRGAA